MPKPPNHRTNQPTNYRTTILASNSPRRRQLLGLVVEDFRVQPADVDESRHAGESPQAYVLRLAEEKARAVGVDVDGDTLVVAADTTVVDGDEILGKPADPEEAGHILRRLRGRTHQVLTGLAVFSPGDLPNRPTDVGRNGISTGEDERLVKKLVATNVPMRDYSDREIEDYIASGDPFDKAGAYAIQNEEFRPVVDLSGCFANVMGFPLCHFMLVLEKFGILIRAEVPRRCQKTLGYVCPIFEQVLNETL